MSVTTASDLQHLDLALSRLRRLWDSPVLRRRLFDQLGLRIEQSLVRTLRAIERTEADAPGVSDVAELLVVDDSTASRLVDQAVAAGLAERTTAAHDRRRCVLRLTPDGTELLERAMHARTSLLRELTAGWPPGDVATLATLLDRLAASVTEAELNE